MTSNPGFDLEFTWHIKYVIVCNQPKCFLSELIRLGSLIKESKNKMITKIAKNKVQFQEKFDPNVKTVIRNVPGIVQTKIDGKSFEIYLEKIKSHCDFIVRFHNLMQFTWQSHSYDIFNFDMGKLFGHLTSFSYQ